MGIFQRLRAAVARSPTVAQVKMVTETGNGLYVYDGNLYKSDIVRACIRPKIKAVGKATPRHIRTTIGPDGKTNTQTNPDPYIRLLLEEPNQYMTWQMYAEKMETQLILNNNAFALIQRDDNGFPVALFPIVASLVRVSRRGQYQDHLRRQRRQRHCNGWAQHDFPRGSDDDS